MKKKWINKTCSESYCLMLLSGKTYFPIFTYMNDIEKNLPKLLKLESRNKILRDMQTNK